MRSNRKILFGVLILIALVVLYGLFTLLSNGTRTAVAPPPSTSPARPVSTGGRGQIYVAAADIPARSIITREMLKPAQYDGPALASLITDPNAQAVGFITRVPIPRNSQIRPGDDFVGHINEVGIGGALQPGTRALVIPLGNKPTLHDLIHIGNYVDVLAAFDGQESRTIVQGVRVLAVDVFNNAYPETSAASWGPYKAPARGQSVTDVPAAPGAPGAASGDATPTPTPTAPPDNRPRPDPAITLEVTPAQAAAIQLAQSSGAAIDYLLLPALPGGNTTEPISNRAGGLGEGETTAGTTTPGIVPVSVNKLQIAPYAERRKQSGGGGSTRSSGSSAGRSSSGGYGRPIGIVPEPTFPPPGGPGPMAVVEPTMAPPPAPTPPPTYTIPIYADGRVVRSENVLTPPTD